MENYFWKQAKILCDKIRTRLVARETASLRQKLFLKTQALAHAEHAYKVLGDSMPLIAWVMAPDGLPEYFNDCWFRYTGLVKESFAKPGALERTAGVVHPNELDAVLAKWEACLAEGKTFELELRLHRHDGEYRWHQAKSKPWRDDSGHIVRWVGTSTDVHDFKVALAELEQARQEAQVACCVAEKANQTKSDFLATMSHEIRTPLGAVLGFSELLASDSLDPEERGQYLQVIRRNGLQLAHLIADILDLSKVEAGKITVEQIAVNSKTFIDDLATAHAGLFGEKGLEFLLTWDETLPETFESDPVRLRQIISNLLTNACKFTDEGSVSCHVAPLGGFLVVDVTDTGVGISPEQIGRLFKPFTQADSSHSRRYGGTGLGLSLSRRLAEALGGRLTLLSTAPGVGSTFRLLIPLVCPLSLVSGATKERSGAVHASPELKQASVLIVDDSGDNRLLMSRYLKRLQVGQVSAADGGPSALCLVESQAHPDVILLDIQMPGMDGYETLAALRSAGYRGAVIAVSAHAMKDELSRAFASGFNGYITKPIDSAQLTPALVDALRVSQRESLAL